MDFEVIRPKYAGLDVHKKPVVVTVCTSDCVNSQSRGRMSSKKERQ